MSDAMRWTPDPPADDRPEPLLHIDLSDADWTWTDPAAAQARVEQAVADWYRSDPLDTP